MFSGHCEDRAFEGVYLSGLAPLTARVEMPSHHHQRFPPPKTGFTLSRLPDVWNTPQGPGTDHNPIYVVPWANPVSLSGGLDAIPAPCLLVIFNTVYADVITH